VEGWPCQLVRGDVELGIVTHAERDVEGWPCQLVRGDVELGIVTHDPRQSAGPWEVGWLEPTVAFETLRQLFEEEQRLCVPLIELTTGALEEADLLAQLALIQQEIMQPGMKMIRVADGQIYEVVEIHMEGLNVYWR
jgi:hypothetical protein